MPRDAVHGRFSESLSDRNRIRLHSRFDHACWELPRDSVRYFSPTADDKHVLPFQYNGNSYPQRMNCHRLLFGDHRRSEKLVNAQPKNSLKQSRRCRSHASERTTVRASARNEPLKMADAQRSGLAVLASESFGVLGELLEGLPTVPDLLFEHGTNG